VSDVAAETCWRRPRWQRLRWKLTLSFTLVTVTAVLVLFVAYGAFAVQRESGPDAFETRLRYLPILVDGIGARLEPHLGSPAVLDRLLNAEIEDTLGVSSRNPLTVIDAAGTVLASLDDQRALGSPIERWLAPNEVAPVRAALAATPFIPTDRPSTDQPWIAWWRAERNVGGDPSAPIVTSTSARSFLVAVPLMASDRTSVAGALLYQFDLDDERGFIFRIISGVLLIGLLIATGLAIISGTVFGFLHARHLTRRLSDVSNAADAWSRGDFSVRAPVTPPDELGQLAGRLNRMASELRALLTARQELATLEERNRLALDLHDSVKQQAFATAMQVSTARALLGTPEAAERHLGEAEALAQQIQQELTTLIGELRPRRLSGHDLVATLDDEVGRWSRQSGIAASVSYRDIERLDMPQTLLRVVHEALANVAKHSGATEVTLRLEPTATYVTLTLYDNGRGFNLDTVRRGVGLTSMRERLEQQGGTLKIGPAPGQGTRVVARWPLPLTPAQP
jgi:NarL family two-component system sensor histidine kinase LiaS